MPRTDQPSFLMLDQMHVELDEMFAHHQELLVGFDLAAAAARLDAFLDRLRLHMRHEEEWLLPIYAARGGRREHATRPQCEIYLLEHAKLLRLLADTRAEIEALVAQASCSRRQVIAVLDHETTIKRVIEHHGERERSILYPELDRLTSLEERGEIIDRCIGGWDQSDIRK